MKENEERILSLLENSPFRTVESLSRELNCSTMTIRRYLDVLQEKGFVSRSHGIAYLNESARPTIFNQQLVTNKTKKIKIAELACSFIEDNDFIILDSGTSVQWVAELINEHLHLSILTPSIPAAETLSLCSNVNVFVPPGKINRNNLTIEATELSNFERKARIAFLSCRSLFLPLGTYEHTNTLIETKRLLANNAEMRVLLCDSSKFNLHSIVPCLPITSFDAIITDDGVKEEDLDILNALGVKVYIANTN